MIRDIPKLEQQEDDKELDYLYLIVDLAHFEYSFFRYIKKELELIFRVDHFILFTH